MEIQVARKILDANDRDAQDNRNYFDDKAVFVLNMMSSPGSGKTTILQKTLSLLLPEVRTAVIVGDISTTNDADRLAGSGAPVVQINTDAFGGDCHLNARHIGKTARSLDLDHTDILFIENVGNLVCPAEFDIGEDVRAVVLSVTEGEDKPLKYPAMFRRCDVALLNKIDLLPYLEIDKAAMIKNILRVNPEIKIYEMSATRNQGLEPWVDWLKTNVRTK